MEYERNLNNFRDNDTQKRCIFGYDLFGYFMMSTELMSKDHSLSVEIFVRILKPQSVVLSSSTLIILAISDHTRPHQETESQ